MNKGPVFIVGMNGSGTTMLADSLGKHPDLYVLPMESKVLPYYIVKGHETRGLQSLKRLADAIGREKPFWQSNKKQNVVLSVKELENCNTIPQVIDALYRYLADKVGKKRWGDKSPVNTQHILTLASAFPDAKFVHIIRDGRDAAQSFHRRWGYHPMHTITRWKKIVGEGMRQGREIGFDRYLEVSYEALTEDPASHMRVVCEFLDLAFHENVLRSSMRHMAANDELVAKNEIVKNSGKWRMYFDHSMIEAMEEVAGGLLTTLGYETSIAGDKTPTAATLMLWRLRDRAVFTSWYFRRYGFGALPMFSRLVASSARQWKSSKH